MSGEGELAGVNTGLGLWDAAVVDLDLLRFGGEDEASGGCGPARNAQSLGVGGCGGADGDGDFGCGVTVVAYLDGDHPTCGQTGARGEWAGGDVGDTEVGQAAVAVDPVVEEPVEIFVGGSFECVLQAGGIAVELSLEAVCLQGLLERVVADDGAEHPPDGRGLGAVEDLAGGVGEAGARDAVGLCCVAGRLGFDEREGAGGILQIGEGGGAARGSLGPEQTEELGQALVDPGVSGLDPGVGEGVGE